MFTYDPSLADDISKVRFYVGDVDGYDIHLDDLEIAFLLDLYDDDVRLALLPAVNSLISRISRLPQTQSLGSMSLAYTERLSALYTLRSTLSLSRSVSSSAGGAWISNNGQPQKFSSEGRYDQRLY